MTEPGNLTAEEIANIALRALSDEFTAAETVALKAAFTAAIESYGARQREHERKRCLEAVQEACVALTSPPYHSVDEKRAVTATCDVIAYRIEHPKDEGT